MNTLQRSALIFIGITAVLHVGFFYKESISFIGSKLTQRFNWTLSEAIIVKTWALNLGFYNLFLAIGLLFSIFLINKGIVKEGRLLAIFILLFIIGAGIVLFISEPILEDIAIVQALPALISVVLLVKAFPKSLND